MSEHEDDGNLPPKLRHERPFLFPWNRRLRHLHGISLRNLHVSLTSARRRGVTITDDDAPYNLVSPTKRALQNDNRGLTHSRSYTDLSKSLNPSPIGSPKKSSTSYEQNGTGPGRPPANRLRRRSTLHWSSGNPRTRQQKLEDVVSSRLADSWVSLHGPHAPEPFYISEVIEKSMNPSFAFFDLDGADSKVSRSDECTVRVWARNSTMDKYCLLVDLDFNLRSLQYIGRNLENFHHPLPENCILFHLSDGIYTSFTDLPAEAHGWMGTTVPAKTTASFKAGSSFEALMQLANLDDCIQDAIKIRSQLEADINSLLARVREGRRADQELSEQRDRYGHTAHAVSAEQKQLRQLRKKRAELRAALVGRRNVLETGREAEIKVQLESQELFQMSADLSTKLQKNGPGSLGQIRRISETLLQIFPIEPIKTRTLQFMIRDIHLPNSTFNDTNRDEIAAAFGFTAQLVYQLSLYLSIALPYPIEPYGSESFIDDPISVALAQRKFPLHPTSVAYKFEYGVFLLNKDIEFLMNRSGLRVLDIRHTLPNLKYLLYVLTTGTGELPARKAGGVRGLLGSRITPTLSRRTSDESVQSQSDNVGSLPRRSELSAASSSNGRPGLPYSPSKAKDAEMADDPFVGAPPTMGLPYRHRILRDAG